MMRRIAMATVLVAVGGGAAAAQDAGRYVITAVPLGVEDEVDATTVLLDSQTGRTWHVVIDDKGRPRWRAIEYAGGTQGVAEPPPEGAEPPSD